MPDGPPATETAGSARRRPIEHHEGPLLVLGAPGTGKTELLAQRLAHLVGPAADPDLRPERVLMISSGHTTAGRLRERCEALVEGSFEEL